MAKKYHVWIETENGITLLQKLDYIEDLRLDLSIFRKGILTITYEEED